MFSSWLHGFGKQKSAAGKRPHLRRRAFRPEIEQLEARLVPAALTTIASFGNADGTHPYAGLVEDAQGNFFGTTTGNYDGKTVTGSTVFELVNNHNGSYTIKVLYSLDPNWAFPISHLLVDSSGNLFGTTVQGGTNGDGTVFELTNNNGSYAYQVLYSFTGGADGSNPHGSVIADASGNLFGTAEDGGTHGDGSVFELVNNHGSYAFQTLYSFTGGADGAFPDGSLIADANGDLFGTAAGNPLIGVGTVFELANHNNSGFSFQVLSTLNGATNGLYLNGGLIEDANGDFFGTTASDVQVPGGGPSPGGTVFELVNSGGEYTFRTLTTFTTSSGDNPNPRLIEDEHGNIFGTTEFGGTNGRGTVFELVNNHSGYAFQTLYSFTGGADGAAPGDGVIEDGNGNLFGTTIGGGANGGGAVFELTPSAIVAATNPNATYIQNLYELLLHRAPDAAGAASWVNLLDGGMARFAVVFDFEQSTEYRNDVVEELYLRYLGRDADSGGLKGWSNFLASGGTTEQVIAGLVSSPEFALRFGSSNSAFVSNLYKDVLGRTGTTAEVQSWVNVLNHGAGRAEVAKDFLTSTEYLTDLVNSYYTNYLGRSADPVGRAGWVKALQGGMSDSAVLAAILGSEEAKERLSS